MPTAPPWYYYKYNFAPANYNMSGDPAGLIRVDQKFHIDFYKNMFYASPVVFGSFPSLHVAWPTVLALFVAFETTLHKAIKVAAAVYVAYVSLAVIYLQHHYFADVFGGVFYSTVVYKFLGPKMLPKKQNETNDVCSV
jgi:membrane-associated phospholipid phosphatase